MKSHPEANVSNKLNGHRPARHSTARDGREPCVKRPMVPAEDVADRFPGYYRTPSEGRVFHARRGRRHGGTSRGGGLGTGHPRERLSIVIVIIDHLSAQRQVAHN